jgi:hypothetical protein
MTDWEAIAHAVHRYPSPHNSQPMRLRPIDDRTAQLCYDLDRGLPAEPYGIPFGHVCAGIFVELVAIAAHAAGLEVIEGLHLGPLRFSAPPADGRGTRLHDLGTLTLRPAGRRIDDLDPALIDARRTSRLSYTARVVAPAVLAEVRAEAERWGHHLADTTDPAVVDRAVAINARTLFDDLATPAVRRELQTWPRYSPREAARRGDGLSAACLGLPGPVLRWFVEHHAWWSGPLPGAIARWLYLCTTRGVRQLAWLAGPFETTADFIAAGRAFIRVWLRLTAHGVAVHPLGSVITNPRSHAAFTATVGADEEEGLTWMLLRIGYSAPPPVSHRLPAEAVRGGGDT